MHLTLENQNDNEGANFLLQVIANSPTITSISIDRHPISHRLKDLVILAESDKLRKRQANTIARLIEKSAFLTRFVSPFGALSKHEWKGIFNAMINSSSLRHLVIQREAFFKTRMVGKLLEYNTTIQELNLKGMRRDYDPNSYFSRM